MKKAVKRLLVLFLALTFIVTDLAVAPVTAQAAGTLKFHKSIALMKGEEIGYSEEKIIKNPLIKRPWSRLQKVIPERQKYVSLQRRATR